MTFIHHYNITEYIHCPKYSLCSTYSYLPPRPTAFPHYTLATSDLENLFHESRNSVSHRNRGDRNRSFNYFQCCQVPIDYSVETTCPRPESLSLPVTSDYCAQKHCLVSFQLFYFVFGGCPFDHQ